MTNNPNELTIENSVVVLIDHQPWVAFGVKSIALTGRSGGDLGSLADIAIKVPADNVAEIQELHLPVYHWLSTELEAAFFSES